LFLLLLAAPAAWGRGRAIAVLEYRAGVRSAPRIAAEMAREIADLTSNQVINPEEARLKLGASIDARVARCQGDAACLARLGSRLGCDEIILVGISQLGDLIIAIQRIEVARRRVIARLADSINPRQRLSREVFRGYLQRLLPSADFKRYGWITIKTDAAGDEVFLDDVPRGHTPLPALKAPATGNYTLRVRRPAHEDFVARLDIVPDATVEVAPTLSRKAHAPRWYERWWVWALIGGAVTAGTTAGLVSGLSQGPDRIPAIVRQP